MLILGRTRTRYDHRFVSLLDRHPAHNVHFLQIDHIERLRRAVGREAELADLFDHVRRALARRKLLSEDGAEFALDPDAPRGLNRIERVLERLLRDALRGIEPQVVRDLAEERPDLRL